MKKIQNLPLLIPRKRDAHKGNFGRILIIAGSSGMMGAACLTARACLRAGAGLVTLAVPNSLLPIAACKLTCAMTTPLPETKSQSFSQEAEEKILSLAENMDVVALGPGLSQHPDTIMMVQSLLPKLNKPIVLDADGLNAIAHHPEILRTRKNITIITPHPGEFSRLTGQKIHEISKDRLNIAQKFATDFHCFVVLKFAPTMVVDSNQYYQNTTGNPGMATGGSGDVLTGIIAAFLGQGLDAFAACQLGVYIHGKAGDLAALKYGEISMIASDILDCLPKAIQKLA